MARKCNDSRIAPSVPDLDAPDPTDADLTHATVIDIPPISAQCFQRKPVILNERARPTARFAEVAGSKTAECAAICCCFPWGIVNLVILAAVRLPAGICRRALRKRIVVRREKRREKLLGSGSGSGGNSGGGGSHFGSATDDDFAEFTEMRATVLIVLGDSWPSLSPSAEVIELEKEVWPKFCSSGFWRSPSR